jgi:hypothetical protein
MPTFLTDLKSYLVACRRADNSLIISGPDSVGRDVIPDTPDTAIGLFVWAHSIPSINYGLGTRYVQVAVRALDGDDAYNLASELLPFLDSGSEETAINLSSTRSVTGRPRSGVKKLSVDTLGRTTYYFDVALFGSNLP